MPEVFKRANVFMALIQSPISSLFFCMNPLGTVAEDTFCFTTNTGIVHVSNYKVNICP